MAGLSIEEMEKNIRRIFLIFSFLCTFSHFSHPLCATGETTESQNNYSFRWELFPSGPSFKNLLADPGETNFGVLIYKEEKSKYLGFDGYIGHIAKIAELTKYRLSPEKGVNELEYRLRIGLGGSAIASGEWKGSTYSLRTVDLFGVFPIDFRKDHFFARLEFGHISSHLIEKATRQAITYSREFAEIVLSYEVLNVRLYAGTSLILHGIPKPSSPLSLQWGIELETLPLIRRLINPYAAFDFQVRGDFNYSCDFSLQVGTRLTGKKKFRVALIYYNGKDLRGQFYGEKRSFLGTGIFIDF